MNELTYNKTYTEFKYEMGTELSKASESFVRIGYLLKVARDTNVLVGTEYERDYISFAEKEFGLEKTQVSRFIRINDRFSVGGNSTELLEQYKGFGTRKLGIMLTLPEEVTEELTPDFTVEEITEVKEIVKEEQEVTPIEAYQEAQAAVPNDRDLVEECMFEILKDHPHLFKDIMKESQRAYKILSPVDQMMYTLRLPGKGKNLVTFHEDKITVFNPRTNEKESFFKNTVEKAIDKICIPGLGEEPEKAYKDIFGQDFPQEVKEEKPKKEEKKEKRLDSNATKRVQKNENIQSDKGVEKATEPRREEEQKEETAKAAEQPKPISNVHPEHTKVRMKFTCFYGDTRENLIIKAMDEQDYEKALKYARQDLDTLQKAVDALQNMQNWRETE